MSRLYLGWMAALGLALANANVEAEQAQTASKSVSVEWHDDYSAATAEAVKQRKLLFLFFHNAEHDAARNAFEQRCLIPSVLESRASRYIWARIPVNAEVQVQGQSSRILGHPAFAEMHGRQGVAIVDYETTNPQLVGRVVSAFPFDHGRYYTDKTLGVILDLPRGTLTQRTMIFAVRIHPEAPESTHGQADAVLLSEAQSHSHHQASIGVQGHHSWDSRFHRINGKLPANLTAQEVVAESWPNQTLVEACIDCVDSWRQSSGHWNKVRSRHSMFGYDIKRGVNGIWYATGIFAR